MAARAHSTPDNIFRLVPNTGHSSPLFDLIKDYCRAREDAARSARTFDRAWKALPRKERASTMQDEVLAMQDTAERMLSARRAIIEFIDNNL